MIEFLNWWVESWWRVVFAVFMIVTIAETLQHFAYYLAVIFSTRTTIVKKTRF